MSGRAKRRAVRILELRRADYDRLPATSRTGRRKPGSLSPRKTRSTRKKR